MAKSDTASSEPVRKVGRIRVETRDDELIGRERISVAGYEEVDDAGTVRNFLRKRLHLPQEKVSAIPPTSIISPSAEPLSTQAICAPRRRITPEGDTFSQVPFPARSRVCTSPSDEQDEVIPPMATMEDPSLVRLIAAKA